MVLLRLEGVNAEVKLHSPVYIASDQCPDGALIVRVALDGGSEEVGASLTDSFAPHTLSHLCQVPPDAAIYRFRPSLIGT